MEWMHPTTADSDPRWFVGDPADLLDAVATLLQSSERPEWHAQAACRGVGPAAWYPDRGAPTDAAVTLCSTCRVRTECLEAGQPELHGIWGGLNPRQRRRAARIARRQADAAAASTPRPDPHAVIYDLLDKHERAQSRTAGR